MEQEQRRHARFFMQLHPASSMAYFVCVCALTLACFHPAMSFISLVGGTLFSLTLRGKRKTIGTYKFVLPMFLLIVIGNPLFNHRGATMLFMLFDQWITLEALAYGVASACELSAIIVWFSCYQHVMTSDKFLYLFGNIAPNTALLITMTLRFIPKLKKDAADISAAETMLNGKPERLTKKLGTAMRSLSVLLTMSMENAVDTADSMRSRGYGCARRTTFHLFRFDARSALTLVSLLSLAVLCAVGRIYGYGYMDFYPRMVANGLDAGWIITLCSYAVIMLFGAAAEIREAAKWRLCGLTT